MLANELSQALLQLQHWTTLCLNQLQEKGWIEQEDEEVLLHRVEAVQAGLRLRNELEVSTGN